jgi:CO/xanthine dehydrogenase FAD-binding subunit
VIAAGRTRIVRPTTLEAALGALRGAPRGTVLLAGGTDLLVTWNAGGPVPQHVIDLWGVRELAGASVRDGMLRVGALTTYTELIRAADVRAHAPALVEAARTVGAVQIQNRGTLGGNVANASPAGDTLPVLLAMDADIVVASEARGERAIPAEKFWVAYRKTALAADELILRVDIPVRDRPVEFRKVGTRRAQAISKVVMALSVGRDSGGLVHEPRIAYGSVAPTPVRAHRAEQALVGRPLGSSTIEAACAALEADISPIDDLRSTREYRQHVSAAILRRALEDLG